MREMRAIGEKGFTQLELLVVMGILSILLAIAVPRFSNSLGRAEIQAHNANVSLLEQAAELAYLGGDLTLTGSGTVSVDIAVTLVGNGYLKEVPVNPTGGAAYAISVSKAANGTLQVTVTPLRQDD
jgi:prepilin-type N-terminal cleavage/methylation domain-containing protein